MSEKATAKKREHVQVCGFRVGDGFYSVPVLDVQEVIKPQRLTTIPLSQPHYKGLINLRGQIVTAISLRSLFGLQEKQDLNYMNVIIRCGDNLSALMVDEICDVMDVLDSLYETTPESLREKEKKYIKGVYKLERDLLVLLDIEKLLNA